jgi:hypothetical protein
MRNLFKFLVGLILVSISCNKENPVPSLSYIEFEFNEFKIQGKYEDCGWLVTDKYLEFWDCDLDKN